MAQTFRFYGPEIGKEVTIVDADVSGVTTDGAVEFTPNDGSLTTFTLTTESLRGLIEDGFAYDKAAIDTSDELWKALDDIENRRKNAANDAPFRDAATALFTQA